MLGAQAAHWPGHLPPPVSLLLNSQHPPALSTGCRGRDPASMAGLRQRLSNLLLDLAKMQGSHREAPAAAAGRGRVQGHNHGCSGSSPSAVAVQTV